MELRPVTLQDRFEAEAGRVLATGTQALLIALLRQRRFDRARGYRTAGFLSGYRGSPLATVDTEAERAARHLDAHDISFRPGINEDLAMTAVWGSQQVALDPAARVGGVFGMWYGKGAGLDRSGDVLRHAHGAGASRLGGVLVVSGDDHALKSSSQAYHSEPTFIDMQMPVLAPADLQEVLDFSLLGWEMSRHSGCYVGLKVLAEHVNSTGVVDVGLERVRLADLALPQENDRWIRWPDPWPEVERRLLRVKLPAALDFARANGLNRIVIRAERPQLGIVASGKCYRDLLEALSIAGLSLAEARASGLSILKIGMPWPADREGLRDFARGHPRLLVIEEKRDLIEAQLRDALYGQANAPEIFGHLGPDGQEQLPRVGELDAISVLRALAAAATFPDAVLNRITAAFSAPEVPPPVLPPRAPYFCSGCPHNRSTVVPDGSRALAGVGCHFMATGMERETETFTQMGGEGVPWIGAAPFTETGHVFVNLGEGTYFHSGSLAIRAALAAGVTVTYKILFNDAIAMTGGQQVEGELTVPMICRQLLAEGVRRIEVVADDPARLTGVPAGIGLSGRDDLDRVQRALREVPGVSVLIYDQVCATEKRRRRKRGGMQAAPRRVLINPEVCEGCGDCSVKSNCLSVVPIETDLGRKRAIDQSNCNQDYSCIDGFCPSFVTVEGAELRRDPVTPLPDLPNLPEPGEVRAAPADIVLAGVGGTGIVTVSALLGMAAHLEGRAFTVHDKLGMAQKYGAVHSHVRIGAPGGNGAGDRQEIPGVRIPDGAATLLIAGDLRCAAEPAVTRLLNRESAHLLVETAQAVGGEFTRARDFDFRDAATRRQLERIGNGRTRFLPARDLAERYLGDAIGGNLMLLGHAWQSGFIPLSAAAIDRAIELNGVAVTLNRQAFALGRYFALHPEAADRPAAAPKPLAARIEADAERLTAYQNPAWAARYRRLVEEVSAAEAARLGGVGGFTRAVAENFAKLMSYKDEYEVARLFTDGRFAQLMAQTFEGGGRLSFYLATPMLARRDPATGLPRKRRFGPWMISAFRLLAPLKRLRGTIFDPFGYSAERRAERALIDSYEADMRREAKDLSAETLPRALALARLPEEIRGYGPIKQQAMADAQARRNSLLGAAPHPG